MVYDMPMYTLRPESDSVCELKLTDSPMGLGGKTRKNRDMGSSTLRPSTKGISLEPLIRILK